MMDPLPRYLDQDKKLAQSPSGSLETTSLLGVFQDFRNFKLQGS